MKLNQIKKYMLSELNSLKTKYEVIKTQYDEADQMGKFGICMKLSEAENMYNHFWMICNDLGFIEKEW